MVSSLVCLSCFLSCLIASFNKSLEFGVFELTLFPRTVGILIPGYLMMIALLCIESDCRCCLFSQSDSKGAVVWTFGTGLLVSCAWCPSGASFTLFPLTCFPALGIGYLSPALQFSNMFFSHLLRVFPRLKP